MSDFASASIVRLVKFALHKEGFAMAQGVMPRGATIDMGAKRKLLTSLMERAGPTPLLRIGSFVEYLSDEPAMAAIVKAVSVDDFMSRWQRLERYVHSRHYTDHERLPDGTLLVQHLSRTYEPPTKAENMLIAGLLLGLMQHLKFEVSAVTLSASGDNIWTDGEFASAQFAGSTNGWIFTFASEVGRKTKNSTGTELVRNTSPKKMIVDDPCRDWTVAKLANDLGTSTRTLQRIFQQQGTRFSSLLQEARTASAADLLLHSSVSNAEIGYATGFSDQAHFTRVFKQQTALTPARYRSEFAGSPQKDGLDIC